MHATLGVQALYDHCRAAGHGFQRRLALARARKLVYEHSPAMAGVRTTRDECAELGRRVARKLNGSRGPAALFLPLEGTSLMSVEGAPFRDPDADRALFEALREHVDRSRVELHELDTHINDPEFALALADRLHELRGAWNPA